MHVISFATLARYRIKRHFILGHYESKCKPVLNKHELDYTVDLLIQQHGSHSGVVLGW